MIGTYEELRFTYQCPERLAQHLYAALQEAQAEIVKMAATIAAAQSMHTLEQHLRARAEKKLAGQAPRRINRDREED